MSANRASRLLLTWTRIRDSLWFVPSLAVVFATVLAILLVQIPTPEPQSKLARIWLYGGGAEGARGMLSAIAGSLITVTGVVFSVTIVALQLASSQFTPRVLGSFIADRVNQIVLGVFIGTFTYALLVLRTIRSEVLDRTAFVPQVAVTVAMVLLLVSIWAFIVYINHAARSIQASVILHRETARTLARVDVLFPTAVVPVAHDEPSDGAGAELPIGTPAFVLAVTPGYLQAVELEPLWELERARAVGFVTIHIELHVGAFVIPGSRLAAVWPADIVNDETDRLVRAAFVLGPERSNEQDIEFGLVVISDIALRALSPGINDPTTAIQCIDRLTEILAYLGTRERSSDMRQSPGGGVRLLMRSTSFPRAVGLAFDQIRLFGAENPAIGRRLLEALAELSDIVPTLLHPAVRGQARATVEQARRSVADPDALQDLEMIAARVMTPHFEPTA